MNKIFKVITVIMLLFCVAGCGSNSNSLSFNANDLHEKIYSMGGAEKFTQEYKGKVFQITEPTSMFYPQFMQPSINNFVRTANMYLSPNEQLNSQAITIIKGTASDNYHDFYCFDLRNMSDTDKENLRRYTARAGTTDGNNYYNAIKIEGKLVVAKTHTKSVSIVFTNCRIVQ